MCDITRPHVDSFNWMLKEGLMKAAGVSRRNSQRYVETFLFVCSLDHRTIRIRNEYKNSN